jgi:hypothetical protein
MDLLHRARQGRRRAQEQPHFSHYEGDGMPNTELSTPGTTAPIDRLSLTAAWSRPSATGIDSVTPSWSPSKSGYCFADEA